LRATTGLLEVEVGVDLIWEENDGGDVLDTLEISD
jgi:hypothetical protein